MGIQTEKVPRKTHVNTASKEKRKKVLKKSQKDIVDALQKGFTVVSLDHLMNLSSFMIHLYGKKYG